MSSWLPPCFGTLSLALSSHDYTAFIEMGMVSPDGIISRGFSREEKIGQKGKIYLEQTRSPVGLEGIIGTEGLWELTRKVGQASLQRVRARQESFNLPGRLSLGVIL